jgi:hypothetical protein
VVTACLGGGRCLPQLTTLDGRSGTSGKLGRDFSRVTWSLEAGKTSDLSFANNLTVYAGQLLVAFPRSKVMDTIPTGGNLTYCFKLTVVNWISDSYTTPCFPVRQMRGVALPTAQIFFPSSRALSKDFLLYGNTETSDCGDVSSSFSMNNSWSVTPQPAGWSTVNTNAVSLRVDRYSVTWEAGVPYTFSLLVYLDSGGTTSSTVATLSGVTLNPKPSTLNPKL